MSEPTRWTVATDALARHRATEYPTHCDACSLRWPCDTYELAASHAALLDAAVGLRLWMNGLYASLGYDLDELAQQACIAKADAAIVQAYGEEQP